MHRVQRGVVRMLSCSFTTMLERHAHQLAKTLQTEPCMLLKLNLEQSRKEKKMDVNESDEPVSFSERSHVPRSGWSRGSNGDGGVRSDRVWCRAPAL